MYSTVTTSQDLGDGKGTFFAAVKATNYFLDALLYTAGETTEQSISRILCFGTRQNDANLMRPI